MRSFEMKKLITVFIVILFVFTMSSCDIADVSTIDKTSNTILNTDTTTDKDANSENNVGLLPLPKSDNDYFWPNYSKVYEEFANAGFTNIILDPIYDLTGDEWFTSDGDCEKILVDGKNNFKKGDLYPSNVEIIISYHTYTTNNTPENSDKITATMNGDDYVGVPYDIVEADLKKMGFYNFEYKPMETENDGIENGSAYEVLTKGWLFDSNLKNGEKYDNDTTIIIKYYVVKEKIPNLTAENCPELDELLQLRDPGHSCIADFARKYKGKVIEFDGSIYDIVNHSNYKHRYNILIGAGDFNPNSMRGPNFRLTDVGVYDMGLGAYDEINIGDNVHIIAEVGTYNSNTQFFELEILKMEFRD